MDAIILAAGNSRRFGANKLLHEINGKAMYEYIVECVGNLQAQGVLQHVIVVTQYEEIRRKVQSEYPNIEVLHNGHSEWGISHSIYLGIQKLKERNRTACLFVVGDQPNLKEDSVRRFIDMYETSGQGIGICAHGTRMGNPVIFHEKYYKELEDIKGDKGGKQVAMRHLEDTFLFEIPEMELEDIDVRSIDK